MALHRLIEKGESNLDILIRKAVSDDARALAEVLVSSWRAAYKDIIPEDELAKNTNLEQRTSMFKRMLENPKGKFYIAFDGSNPCGQCMFCESRDADLSGYAEIVSMYALKEYWGKGVGKAMMETALKEIADSGYGHVFLWALKDNIRAKKFYEKFGFVWDGAEKDNAFAGKLPEVRYTLTI